MIPIQARDGGVRLEVKVVPGASRTRISLMADRLKVTVPAPAEKGRANEAVLEALREFFGVPVTLVSGATSPRKTVAVPLSAAAVEARLRALV